jgi:hypothetical protein
MDRIFCRRIYFINEPERISAGRHFGVVIRKRLWKRYFVGIFARAGALLLDLN